MDGYMPDAMSYAEVDPRLEVLAHNEQINSETEQILGYTGIEVHMKKQLDELVVGKELALYVGLDDQTSSSDSSLDVLKQKIEEIRNSVTNPPPI